MIVVMIESTGMFLALGEMTGRKIDQAAIARGLRADGVGTILGGIFNTFPYTSFSQNVGLVGVTGVRSRWVTATGGVIMLVLGLLPKLSALVEAVPVVVLGGAGVVMFGMVAATGARILTGVDFKTNRYNLFVVAISVGFGMIPLVAPNFFRLHAGRAASAIGIGHPAGGNRLGACSTCSSTAWVLRRRHIQTRLRRCGFRARVRIRTSALAR